LAGVVSGPGSLTVTGGGTLILNNLANSYSGGTTVTGGSTLSVNDDRELGGPISEFGPLASLTLDAGTLLTTGPTFDSGRSVLLGAGGGKIDTGGPTHVDTLSGPISDVPVIGGPSIPGSLTVTGGGTLILTNRNNSYSLGTIVTGGSTLSINDNGELGAPSGPLTLDGGTLLTTGPVSLQTPGPMSTARPVTLGPGNGTVNTNLFTDTFAGVVSGPGSLTVTGGGTLILTNGNNSYSLGTTVTGGSTLSIDNNGELGAPSAPLTLDGGTLLTTGPVSSPRPVTLGPGNGTANTDGFTDTLAGVVSGRGSLTVTGGGTLVLSGANTYGGGTIVVGTSTLSVSSDANLGAAGTRLTLAGGTLLTTDPLSSPRPITLGQASVFAPLAQRNGTIDTQGNSDILSGPISDAVIRIDVPAPIVIPGRLTVTGGGTLTLANTANSYSGGTAIIGGSAVSVNDDRELGAPSGTLTLDGGTLTTTGPVSSPRLVTLGPGNGTVNTNGFTDTLAGMVSGPGSLTVTGGGTLVLSGANAYGGGN
jgi:autotransporter-associated beta strand protein